MYKRKRLNRRKSRKVFRKGTGTNKRNVRGAPMRGGIRL